MSSPAVLDIDSLLQPIDESNPTGVNLREDYSPTSPYQALKDARKKARDIERQSVGEDGEGGSADWRPILDGAPTILSEKSKDLEVAVWLIEGLVRRSQFAGLRDGFRLARELVVRFWDNLYPMPDEEDGIGRRVAPMMGLEMLISWIENCPLTQGKTAGPFTRASYRQAEELEGITDPDKRRARIERGAVTMDKFKQAVAETPAPFFANLVEDLKECTEAYDQLCAALDEKCGSDAPPTSRVREALESCLDVIMATAKDKLDSLVPQPAAGEAAGAGAGGGNGAAAGPGVSVGEIRTRDQAFESLLRVAQFFREREPQSPVPYALEQVVRWGRMPLPALLTELLPEETARQSLFKMVGIPEPKTESE